MAADGIAETPGRAGGPGGEGPALSPADLAEWQRAADAANARRYAEALAIIHGLQARNPADDLLMHSAMRIPHNAHDSERAFRAAWELSLKAHTFPVQHGALSQALFWAPFVSYLSPLELGRLGERWAQHLATAMRNAPLPPPPPRQAGRRLRIGYLSPAFGFPADYHPLAQHDPAAVETYAYSSGPTRIGAGTVVPKFGRFRDLFGMLDLAAATIVRNDDIDILVDLGGTGDAQRNGILAYRPARVQVGWSNKLLPQFPPLVDWVIGDAELFAPGDFAMPGGARLLALPQALCVVAEMSPAPAIVPPPALAGGPVTIGSSASIYKITDSTLRLWSRVLHRLPEAVFSYSTPYMSDLMGNKIRQGFAANGIDPARYRLEVRPHGDFAQAMNNVDMALDSIPFSSNYSCLQALRQGVPVIALAGDRLAGRFSASLLRTIGHEELTAPTADGYVDRAVALAGDLPRLQAYRSALPQAVGRARLNDMRLTARCLELAYRQIWEGYCRQESAG